jgi:hypothetical protein
MDMVSVPIAKQTSHSIRRIARTAAPSSTGDQTGKYCPLNRASRSRKLKITKVKIDCLQGDKMQQADSEAKTIITVDLDVDTIEKAELLGLDLSEMANRLLLAEVQRLEKQPGYHEAQIAPPP